MKGKNTYCQNVLLYKVPKTSCFPLKNKILRSLVHNFKQKIILTYEKLLRRNKLKMEKVIFSKIKLHVQIEALCSIKHL